MGIFSDNGSWMLGYHPFKNNSFLTKYVDPYSLKPTGLYNDNGTLVAVYNPSGKGGTVIRGKDNYLNSGMRILPVVELNNEAHKVGDTLNYKGNRYVVVDKGNNKAGLKLIETPKQNIKTVSNNTFVKSDTNKTLKKPTNSKTSTLKPKTKLVSKNNTKITDGTYTVLNGDNLSTIAKRAGISLLKIKELNPQIKNINIIHTGDRINLTALELINLDNQSSPSVNSDIPTINTNYGHGFSPDIEGWSFPKRNNIDRFKMGGKLKFNKYGK